MTRAQLDAALDAGRVPVRRTIDSGACGVWRRDGFDCRPATLLDRLSVPHVLLWLVGVPVGGALAIIALWLAAVGLTSLGLGW